MREQLAHADPTPRRRQVRQVGRDRRLQVDAPGLHQLHHRHASEGLGRGVDREQGRGFDRHAVLDIGQAVAFGEHHATIADHRDLQARDAPRLHRRADEVAGGGIGIGQGSGGGRRAGQRGK